MPPMKADYLTIKPARAVGLHHRIVRWVVRKMTRERLTPGLPVDKQRKVMEQLGAFTMLPRAITHQRTAVGDLTIDWLRPKAATDDRTMLFLHGGAYVLGSFKTHGELVGNLAVAANINTVMPDYRLAPEHPFPAALDDALACYQSLLASGIAAEKIVIAGDSAGGGLTLALLLKLRELELPQPACAYLISPLTDLTLSSGTHSSRKDLDPLLTHHWLDYGAVSYAGELSVENPFLSPLFADLSGLAPLIIQVGDDEILLDDSLQLAEKAHAAGVEVHATVWPNMWHDFQASAFGMAEKSEAISEFAKLVKVYLKPSD